MDRSSFSRQIGNALAKFETSVENLYITSETKVMAATVCFWQNHLNHILLLASQFEYFTASMHQMTGTKF